MLLELDAGPGEDRQALNCLPNRDRRTDVGVLSRELRPIGLLDDIRGQFEVIDNTEGEAVADPVLVIETEGRHHDDPRYIAVMITLGNPRVPREQRDPVVPKFFVFGFLLLPEGR